MSTGPRVALVTGASGGIGQAAAKRLAHDGLAVVVGYSANHARAAEAGAAIMAAGVRAAGFRPDVADETEAADLFSHAEAQYGGVDVVVHAAGISLRKPLPDLDLGDFDRMVRVNLRGTFVVSQLAARHLRKGGTLINFSTSITRLATPTYSAYAATKGAVEATTLIFAREMRGLDITVNTVAPGPTATPLFFANNSPELVATIAKANPMERLGEPADIAEAVSFLAGPGGRWVNGQVLYVNGGAA